MSNAWLLAGGFAVVLAAAGYLVWLAIGTVEPVPTPQPPVPPWAMPAGRHAAHDSPGRRAELAPVPAPARLALPPGGQETQNPGQSYGRGAAGPAGRVAPSDGQGSRADEPASLAAATAEFWAAADDDAATETWLATSLREPARGGRDAGGSPGRHARPSFTAAADLPRPGLGAQGEPATGPHPPWVNTGPGQPGAHVYVPGGWAPVRPYPGLRDLMNDADLPQPGREVTAGLNRDHLPERSEDRARLGQPDDTVIEGVVVMDRTWIDDILAAPWVNGELVIRHG